MNSRKLSKKVGFLLGFVLLLLIVGRAYSQDADVAKYPNRPITYIQPFTAGSSTDLAIRLIGKEVEKYLGQPIVVVNKAGGAGSIGVAAIATAKPDGYTLGNTAHSSILLVPHLEKVPYHPVKDLRYIMQFGAFNMGAIVKGDSPFKTFKDVIDYARKNPKKFTYGTSGVTTMQYLVLEQIARREKVEFTHIPQKSSADMQTALLGGHILMGGGDFNYSLVESGEARILFLFREEIAAEYPQTPILKDLGYDLPAPTVTLVAGPKGLPDGIAKKLEDAFSKAVKEPAFIKGMKELRLPVVYRNSKDLTAYVSYNYELFGKLIKEGAIAK